MSSSRLTGINENISTYDSGGGEDYSSLSAWESATDYDLVSAATSEVLEIKAGAHDDAMSLSGATSNGSYRRIIRPYGTLGASSWEGHSEVPKYDGTVACIATVEGNPFTVVDTYVSIQDLVLKSSWTTPAANASCIHINSGADNTDIVGILCTDNYSATADTFGVYIYAGVTGVKITNSLLANMSYGVSAVDAGVTIKNSTICDNGVGLYGWGSDTRVATNVILEGNSTSINNPANWTVTYGTDDDGVTFVDSANDDYRLSFSDSVAVNQGTDLSTDFTDDIAGNERPNGPAWDKGFHELIGTYSVDITEPLNVVDSVSVATVFNILSIDSVSVLSNIPKTLNLNINSVVYTAVSINENISVYVDSLGRLLEIKNTHSFINIV